MAGSGESTRTVRRRGILAAAGAVVAGIVAKQAAQPVAATDGSALIVGQNNTSMGSTLLTVTGNGGDAFNVKNSNGAGIYGQSDNSYGVYALTKSNTGTGMYGQAIGASATGVFGLSSGFSGVGVGGQGSGGTGIGVHGISFTYYGVLGESTSGAGVLGLIPSTSNSPNAVGVFGNNLSTGASGVGVYGSCANGTGIYGQTAASNQYGVLGTTYAPNSTAIAGTCTGNGSSAFSGGTANPNAFAAFFQGTTVVQGNFAVTGTKSAALAHPDGSHRLVYCVETPDSWLEDVGSGTLSGGKATVTFDKEFAALVKTDGYHVFLTEYGETQGLFVSQRSAGGFVVQERNKGTASGTFSWKVMVPRGDVKAERLGKFVLPNLPLPDTAKFKAPDLPTHAVPPKKP